MENLPCLRIELIICGNKKSLTFPRGWFTIRYDALFFNLGLLRYFPIDLESSRFQVGLLVARESWPAAVTVVAVVAAVAAAAFYPHGELR